MDRVPERKRYHYTCLLKKFFSLNIVIFCFLETYFKQVVPVPCVHCNVRWGDSVYWFDMTRPAGPRPTLVPPMLAWSGVKPSSSFGMPYCCSFPSYVWRRSSCALHTLASSYCKSWMAEFLRHSSSWNVAVVYAYCSDHSDLGMPYPVSQGH
jgi:hypothetical protein